MKQLSDQTFARAKSWEQVWGRQDYSNFKSLKNKNNKPGINKIFQTTSKIALKENTFLERQNLYYSDCVKVSKCIYICFNIVFK